MNETELNYKGPFCIEIEEIMGVWETEIVIAKLLPALHYASDYIWKNYWPESKIRIVDINNKII